MKVLKLQIHVNFKPDGRSYCHGFHMIKVLGKCVVKHVLKQGNTFTTGCTTYKTSSMIKHEATTDHKISVAAPKLNNNITAALNNAKCEQDETIIKILKLVNWLACENVPLSKFESLMNLLKELGVPGLGSLNIGDRIDYNSYYTANELLEAISNVLDEKNRTPLKESPYISLFTDESTDIANKKRITMTARIVDPSTSIALSVFLSIPLTFNMLMELVRAIKRNIYTKWIGSYDRTW